MNAGTPQLRIAVAGAGAIGRRHMDLLSARTDVVLCAIADPDPAATGCASAHGVPRYERLADLLDRERPDGVIVATPNAVHVENGLACVERGIPVLVEKPIADTLDEGERLALAAEAARVPLLVGHHRRHSPILAAARTLIAAGTLGRLVAVTGTALFYKPDAYFDAGPWRRERGGGPILINLIHEVDDLRALCGDIVAVQARASRTARGFAVEDTVAITLEFANGALGTFLLSDTAASARSWEQTSGENPDYPQHRDEDCYLVAGTRGSLAIPTMRLRTYAGEPSWTVPFASRVVPVRRDDPLATQLAHFAAVIRGESAPAVSARDALETLRVTLAIVHAASTGTCVSTESIS